MWQTEPSDARTIWMDITARDRNFTFSLFGLGGGVLQKASHEISESTYENLMLALGELTDTERSPEPDAFGNFGSLLFDVALPLEIQLKLLKHEGSLVFSTHELSLPWELLQANERFLSIKHAVSRQLPTLNRIGEELIGYQPMNVQNASDQAVLLIADPAGDLPGAAEEADELRMIFENAGVHCDALIGPKECTYQNVMAARLGKKPYRVIHFSGHAQSLEQDGASAILLAGGRKIMAQEIQRVFKGEPLVFLNACWSAMNDSSTGANARQASSGSNIVRTLTEAFMVGNRAGRARAIIGSMWWIADDVARGLAGCFYQEMLAGHPLGEALRRARQQVSNRVTDPALWSTYVLFGDPHQRFLLNTGDTPTAAGKDPEPVVEPPKNAEHGAGSEKRASGRPDLVVGPPEDESPDPVVIPKPAADVTDGDLPWSDDMRAAFVGAMAAMQAMNWSCFSTVHLVLGLTYIDKGLISKSLEDAEVNPTAARRALRELFTIRDSDRNPAESIVSDNLQKCFETAQLAARAANASEVTEVNVVAAMLERSDAGGTMLLQCMGIDLEKLKRQIGGTVGGISPRDDLLLPDGNLNLDWFDADSRAALEEATLMAYRSYWADLRSPHLFLGVLNRRRSRLAQHLIALQLVDPNPFATSLLASLTNRPDASIRQPKLHREFLSENALLTLRTARDIADREDRHAISETDILSAILGNESNAITATLRKAGLVPQSLMW